MSELDSIADIFEKAIQRNLQRKDSNNTEKQSYGEEYISQLKASCNSLLKKEIFEVGQIVKWKEDLNNRTLPYKNQPAIVVSILDEPVISNEVNSGSPYFLETLDIIIGIITDEGTFLTFYYDSRRFEAY
jgi:hypothetical protein